MFVASLLLKDLQGNVLIGLAGKLETQEAVQDDTQKDAHNGIYVTHRRWYKMTHRERRTQWYRYT
jgi:hypothetical protein